MDMILSHKSALEYWRLYGFSKIDGSAGDRLKSFPVDVPKYSTIRGELPSGLSLPINLVVGSQSAKRKSRLVYARVHTGPIPEGCIAGIGMGIGIGGGGSGGGGLAVSTPPFCLLQMAGELTLVELIKLGFELCGSYSLPPIDDYIPGVEAGDKTKYNRPQLTTTKAIKSFSARMKGVNGKQKVSSALRYIADGSASPMETTITMLLTLPYKLGGYGLPMPELNKQIYLGNANKRKPGIPKYKCDLFWPKANFAIEYNSDFYHTGADRIASDSKRQFDLAELGINVIPVTSRQIRNRVEFERLARLIARKLGKRLQYKNPQFSEAERDLRAQLL